MKITESLYQPLEETKKNESAEYLSVKDNCQKIYERLMDLLNATEQKTLISLSDEYTFLNYLTHEQGFKDGFASAVKMIFETLLSS